MLRVYTYTERNYTYDAKGRLVKEIERVVDAMGNGISYKDSYTVYDEQDRITQQKTWGENGLANVIKFTYDGEGRITREYYAETRGSDVNYSSETVYTYNKYNGTLTQMEYTDTENNSITEKYTYNSSQKLTSYSTKQNGESSYTTVKYDGDLPISTETVYYSDGSRVNCTISYVTVPKAEMNEIVANAIIQVEGRI